MMLDRLRAVALDPSASRSTLLQLLTRSVFAGRAPSEPEIALFADIALRLLPQAEEAVRAELAETLADHVGLPAPLVAALAADVVPVADPMLRRSPDLTDDDLIRLAQGLTEAHRVAIAGRYGLSVAIADVLVRLGELLVLRALAENGSAQLAPATAHRLVEEAEHDDELCQILALRSDLPFEDAERVVMLVARRLRGRMARAAAAASEPAAPIAPPAAPARPLELGEIVARFRRRELGLDDAVQMLAREDRSNDLAGFLAVASGIEELALLKVLVRADADGILQVMRGLDVGVETWSRVVELRRRRLKFSDTQFRFEKDDFERLPVETARQTLAHFSRRRAAG